ncbi:alkene reductase [Rubritalea tangerina]|uniref:Alkene reductase n=2 Tax=Rubritalea tangerina TaxID=430798 RepID=A0ABW4ZE00_9BACT
MLNDSYQLSDLTLKNRIIMAPLTRLRAGDGNAPTPLNAQYYGQRASFGLIISEATPVMPEGHGYPQTPGIYTPKQIAAWKTVTQAVHNKNGRIFCQLWHCGRISHNAYQPNNQTPPAPSPVNPHIKVMHPNDWHEMDSNTPHAMTQDEIHTTIKAFKQAVENAKEAGFDGVEIHGANGYLINQFLIQGVNTRQDQYGGSIENRARFLFEVLDATVPLWPGRVGLRLSPPTDYKEIESNNLDDRAQLFSHVIKKLNDYQLAYLHLVEPRMYEDHDPNTYSLPLSSQDFRPLYNGTLISAGGHTKESAETLINSGQADLIAFGRDAIANPDLPERLAKSAPLNAYNRDTFYGGDATGYTDYPSLK